MPNMNVLLAAAAADVEVDCAEQCRDAKRKENITEVAAVEAAVRHAILALYEPQQCIIGESRRMYTPQPQTQMCVWTKVNAAVGPFFPGQSSEDTRAQ